MTTPDAGQRLIEDLRDFKDNEPDSYHDKLIEQAIAEIERLRGVEDDARRYRAICMRLRGLGGYTIGIIAQHAFSDDSQLLVGPEADAAIDAALDKTP